MAKVTSKLQVTVPKALAQRYRIAPGDEIAWEGAGDSIRVVPARTAKLDLGARLALFDAATKRQAKRTKTSRAKRTGDRGWTREELYARGRAR